MKNKEVLLAILGGVAAGALIGFLVTREEKKSPESLERERDDYFGNLKDKYGDMLDRLNKKLDALKDEFEGSERLSRY